MLLPEPPLLAAQGISVVLGGSQILSEAAIVVAPGELIGIVGPNGSGKSTFLRVLSRLLRPTSGSVRVDGVDLWRLSSRDAARRLAVVLQDHPSGVDLTAREVVMLGRLPHRRSLGGDGAQDHRIVAQSLARVHATELAERAFPSLSGGERQRVLIARSLAQQAQILFLDEPTNHLDVRAQLDLLSLVRSLSTTTVCVLHDLDQAAAVCDRVLMLDQGRVVAVGTPDEVLTADRVREVFGVSLVLGHVPGRDGSHLRFESLTGQEEPRAVGERRSLDHG